MNYKYIILDFGKVIAGPFYNEWDFTPTFLKYVDISKLDMNKYKSVRDKYIHILYEKIINLDEEYDMFIRFFTLLFNDLNLPNINEEKIKEIAFDRTYKNDKYTLYSFIYEELDYLKEKATLIMLTDNWPCVINYLKENKLYDYFDKIYVSSIYGKSKREDNLYDDLINDYNIKEKEALFIDDVESNLDKGKKRGFDCILMDRYNKVTESKYKIVHDLFSIDK